MGYTPFRVKQKIHNNMATTPKEVVVLNTIQAAAADSVLDGGKHNINDGSVDLSTAKKLVDGLSFTATAYAAGTLSAKEVDFAAVSLTVNTQYRLAVIVPDAVDFNGGGAEANELIPIREYIVWAGTVAYTAATLKTAFIARINADSGRKVNATDGGAGVLDLTLIALGEGDFTTEQPVGAVAAVNTPFVAPSGTPTIVEALAPTLSSPTATYTTYRFAYNELSKRGVASGGQAIFDQFMYIFADAGAANYAAFNTELLAVFAGTHTPVADYLGV